MWHFLNHRRLFIWLSHLEVHDSLEKMYSINTFIFWGILIPDIRVVQCLLWKNSSMCHLLIFLFSSWQVGDLTLKFHVVCKKPNPLWKFCVLKLGARLKTATEVVIGENSGYSALPVEFRFNNLIGIFFFLAGEAFSCTMASRLVPKVSLQCSACAWRCPLEVQHYKRVHVT